MIAAAEIHRNAREWKVDPMIVELDYVLGCFLSRWFRHPIAAKMIFKGGTCLRKCYFPDYRFSEDIDITAQKPVDAGQLRGAIEAIASELEKAVGVDTRAQPPRIETVDAGDGTPYIEARVYFRGPLQRTGWPQGIRMDVSGGELLVFPPMQRPLHHPYSDAEAVATTQLRVPCYDLREVLLEKLRGLAGQRRYAISRDLYDAHWLLVRAEVKMADLIPHARAKFAAKGVDLAPGMVDAVEARKDEFYNDWSRNTQRLIPAEKQVGFNEAWGSAVHAMRELANAGRLLAS